MVAYMRTLRFFLFGCFVGVVGMLVYGDTPSTRDWFIHAAVNTDTLAVARCVPDAHEDEVFFISCGGIY